MEIGAKIINFMEMGENFRLVMIYKSIGL